MPVPSRRACATPPLLTCTPFLFPIQVSIPPVTVLLVSLEVTASAPAAALRTAAAALAIAVVVAVTVTATGAAGTTSWWGTAVGAPDG